MNRANNILAFSIRSRPEVGPHGHLGLPQPPLGVGELAAALLACFSKAHENGIVEALRGGDLVDFVDAGKQVDCRLFVRR